MQGIERSRSRAAHAILQGLDLATQDAQRRAQLVGDIGTPATARFAVLFKGTREMVEVRRQRTQLIATTITNASRIVARGERTRADGEFAYRGQQPSRQGKCQHQGKREDRHAGNQGIAQLLARGVTLQPAPNPTKDENE